MLEVLDWQSAAEPRAVVRRAVELLQTGHTVAFPTEASYVLAASGLVPQAVERIQPLNDDMPTPLSVAVSGLAGARDWIPSISVLGQRLGRRFWPGPLTLLFPEGVAVGLAARLPVAVQQALCPDGGLRLRSPAHAAILEVILLNPGPLLLAEIGGGTVSPDDVRTQAGDRVDLLIDDGPSSAAQTPTVVEVQGNAWKIVQAGAVTAEQITQRSACVVVFVCTGNTCRSPLAEGLCKKLLAEKVGCSVAELPSRGFFVLSAGLAAMMGGEAAAEAVEVAQGFGADLTGHQSRPLTDELAAQADFLVAMTRDHRAALTAYFPRLSTRPRLLGPRGDDIADPIGSSRTVYQECAEQISRGLEPLIAEMMNDE